jgi:hypothetical protein
MMPDEIILSAFEREWTGRHASVLVRRNHSHAGQCSAAIRRRKQPAWSRFDCGFQVR